MVERCKQGQREMLAGILHHSTHRSGNEDLDAQTAVPRAAISNWSAQLAHTPRRHARARVGLLSRLTTTIEDPVGTHRAQHALSRGSTWPPEPNRAMSSR